MTTAWKSRGISPAMDLGQTVVVRDRACVAIEAMEGTDETIERAARLAAAQELTVVKVSKPRQDMRFDVPVIGLPTIEVMRRSHATALAIDAQPDTALRPRAIDRSRQCGGHCDPAFAPAAAAKGSAENES